jgi:hypothetical protein
MGVKFVGVTGDDQVIAIARNIERVVVEEQLEAEEESPAQSGVDADADVDTGDGPEAATEPDVPVTDAEPQEDSDG